MEKFGKIYLTGFSGSGKTSVGRALTSMHSSIFIDLDEEIEGIAGKQISRIFDEDGEHNFRVLENKILERISCDENNAVIALGGGSLIDKRNINRVKNTGKLIWLRIRWDSIYKRLEKFPVRPLVEQSENFLEFIELNHPKMADRIHGYSQCDIVIDVDDQDTEKIAELVSRLLECRWIITCELGERSYPVICDHGLGQNSAEILYSTGILPRDKIWLVSSENIDQKNIIKSVFKSLKKTGLEVHQFQFRDGEYAKSPDEISRFHSTLLENETSRDDLVVAVGGGSLTDAAGFASAIYKRGLDIVHIPTTLLGMIDASIGGKTAVNHQSGKNLIGAFHQPRAVLIDPDLVGFLPEEQYLSGLAELVKYGFITEGDFFNECENHWDGILNRHEESIDLLIRLMEQAVKIKAGIVSRDEKEITGERMVLNFGHTVGHGIEAASGYEITHGRAVASGMRAAFFIGKNRGLVSENVYVRVGKILKDLESIESVRKLDPDEILSLVKHDKKHRGSKLQFVLPVGIGKVILADDVTHDEMRAAILKLIQ